MATERHVLVRDPGLAVRVEVVRRVEERHDPGEAVLGEPDQLLLPPDLAVVAGEPTRPLRGGEPVLDDPAEQPRLEALGPAAPQRRHRVSTISAARHRGTRHRSQHGGGLHRGPDVVDPDHRRAPFERPHHGGERGVVARRRIRLVDEAAEERLARRPHQHRHPDRGDQLGQRRRAARGCARASCRTRCPGSAISASSAIPAARAAVEPLDEERRDLADDVVVARVACIVRGSPCMCIAT